MPNLDQAHGHAPKPSVAFKTPGQEMKKRIATLEEELEKAKKKDKEQKTKDAAAEKRRPDLGPRGSCCQPLQQDPGKLPLQSKNHTPLFLSYATF